MKFKKTLINVGIIFFLGGLIFLFKNNFIIKEENSTSLIGNSAITVLPDNPLQVEILNGCGEKGVADLYTVFLRHHGFDVVDFKNANHFNYNKTKILLHKDDIIIDELLKKLEIDISNVDYVYNKNIFHDITIIIGKDYKTLNSYNNVSKYYNPFE